MTEINHKERSQIIVSKLIDVRGENNIAESIGLEKGVLTTAIKKAMVNTVNDIIEDIFNHLDQNKGWMTNDLGAFYYSANKGNQNKHLLINGKRRIHCRFTVLNNAMGFCIPLDKGTQFNGTLSSWIFTKQSLMIMREVYSDVLRAQKEIKEEKEMQNEQSLKNGRRHQVRIWVYKNLEGVKKILEDAELEHESLDNLPSYSYGEEDRKKLHSLKKTVEQYTVLHEFLSQLHEAVRKTTDDVIDVMRNLMSFKSNDYQTWCNFLIKNEILETCVESLEEDSDEIEPAVKEVTLPLHIHSEDIEIAISSINDKIDLLRSKGKMKIIVDEISKHEKDIEVLNDITNFGQKCKTHDGCVVMNYTYCSKEGGCGRLTNARSPQGLPKRVRRLLIPKIYSYDIETSVFSILRYLSIKIDQTIIERIPSINAYIENKKEIREELAKRVFMFDKKNVIPFDAKVKMIKSAMTSIGFGGKLQCTIKRDGSSYQAIGDSFNIEKYYNNRSACTNFIEDEYVKKFYGEFNLIKDLIVSHYRDKTDILGGFPFIKDKDSELLSHVYQSFESKILRSVLKIIDDSNGTNGFPFKSQRSILPLHDGICTSWLLDKYVFEKAFRDVLSNDYPDYLPKVELTYLNTEENKSLTDSEIESIKRNHLKDVQKEERLAQQYINNFTN